MPDFDVDWDLASCASEEDVGGYPILVLPPGCEQTVRVAYTTLTGGEVQNAAVVSTIDASDGSYRSDPIHGRGVVYLRGENFEPPSTAASDDPYVVGDTMTMSRTSLVSGETATLELRVAAATPVEYAWSTDDGTDAFDTTTAATVVYTAPEVGEACQGRNANIYAVVTNEDGQDWVFGRVEVWGAGTPIDTCLPACE